MHHTDNLIDGLQKAKGNFITLEGDPVVVEAMLRYIYILDYDSEAAIAIHPPMLLDANLHILADKYEVPGLVKLAESKFENHAQAAWNTAAFAMAAHVVYVVGTNRQAKLRESIIKAASQHAKALYQEDFGASFRHVAKTVASVGSDLAEAIAVKLEDE